MLFGIAVTLRIIITSSSIFIQRWDRSGKLLRPRWNSLPSDCIYNWINYCWIFNLKIMSYPWGARHRNAATYSQHPPPCTTLSSLSPSTTPQNWREGFYASSITHCGDSYWTCLDSTCPALTWQGGMISCHSPKTISFPSGSLAFWAHQGYPPYLCCAEVYLSDNRWCMIQLRMDDSSSLLWS